MNWLRVLQYLVSSMVITLWFVFAPQSLTAADLNPKPPSDVIKLIFIHHSCGENWLSDDNGRLAMELQKNNYFVSDTNYCWGPDAIGDRTDIEDWPQWFTGPDSRRYLAALYQESGRHAPYERTLADPGGENRIVMFKSCFPNSNLTGYPDDPPQRGRGLSVANAKAIYLKLLDYFKTRPDRLFIAVTAPPLQDGTLAHNARAFNQWLVRDWLSHYPGQNVAVFDFFNVLTSRQNHHRYHDGQIQHVTEKGRNTLAYPSGPGDDHPSEKGNRAATTELVPLLNVHVNQWLETAPPVVQVPAETAEIPAVGSAESAPAAQPVATAAAVDPVLKDGLIDDFESGDRDWQVFLDGGPDTRLTGAIDSSRVRNGRNALRIDYRVAQGGWAMYSLVYPSPRDWSLFGGLVIHVQAEKPDQPLIFNVYGGKTPDELIHFEYQTQTSADAAYGWQTFELPWHIFQPPSWQGDGSQRFDPGQSMGMSFIFNAEEGPTDGVLWVDDLSMLPR